MPSGTVMLVRGDVSIQGGIVVAPGTVATFGASVRAQAASPAFGQLGGTGSLSPRWLGVRPAAGGPGASKGLSSGGDGGGALAILAGGSIDVPGSISAFGGDATPAADSSGGGGGSGGFIWLGARVTITVDGVVAAVGGAGAAGINGNRGGGGGGAGGVVHLVAPNAAAPVNGVILVTGGAIGAAAGEGTASGGGGGALGGDGGDGGALGNAAIQGGDGLDIRHVTDEPSIFQR